MFYKIKRITDKTSMANRIITLLPSHLVAGSVITYGKSNKNKVTETEELILAYRKDNGRDKRVRFMVGKYVNNNLKVMPYFLYDKNELTEPSKLKAGHFIWGLSLPFKIWLVKEFTEGRLTEGESYAYKKYKFTLLSKEEMDILADCLIEYGKYDTDYSFEY